MPSMVSANRFINTVAIPLVIVAYGVFLWLDHVHANQVSASYNNQVPASRDHMQRIQKMGGIDGLLFGGSNAVYSLSAEFLTRSMGIKWYNASLINELGTIERHKNFIRELSARIDRTRVRYVVYSSIDPFEMRAIAGHQTEAVARSESRDTVGIDIEPKISALEYIRHQPFRHLEFPERDSFGDIVFENETCNFTAEQLVKHEREDEDISAEFLVDYANFFTSLFPNAAILIVLPSEYRGAFFDDSRFEQTLRTKFYSALKANYSENTIKIIFQPPYSSITQVCDRPFHANEDGRFWRTRNLIELMRAVVRIVPSATAQSAADHPKMPSSHR